MTFVDENKSWMKTCMAGHLVETDSLAWAAAKAFTQKTNGAKMPVDATLHDVGVLSLLQFLSRQNTSNFSLTYIKTSYLG